MDRRLVTIVSLGILAAGCVRPNVRSSYDPFSPPKPEQATAAQLPQLATPITVDGSLDEWQGATSVPMRSRSQFVQLEPGHTWNGPADLSAEFYSGWTEQGLAIGGVVRDDDVINNKSGLDSWQNDCVELFVDGRSDATFMDGQYGKGAYQFFVRPPLDGSASEVVFAHGEAIAGMQTATKRTADGYTLEVLIPWSAFPGISGGPGARVGLAFQVDEVDARDASGERTATLAVPTRDDLWKNTAAFERFVLVDRLQPGGNLGPAIVLDAPGIMGATPPAEIGVTVGKAIAEQARQVRISNRFTNAPKGKANWSVTGPVKMEETGDGTALATGPLVSPMQWPEGYSTVTVEALNADGQVIGYSTKNVVGVGNVVERSVRQVQGAGLPMLAQREPYRAAAWLGAAATIDRLKTAIAREQVQDIGRLVHEVQTRMDTLNRRHHPTVDRAFMHDLLVLGFYPEAQVIVEYPAANKAEVVFNCGPIPMANVVVEQFDSESAAQAMMQNRTALLPTRTLNQITKPHLLSTISTSSQAVDPATLDMHEYVVVWNVGSDMLQVVTPNDLANIRADAVVIGPMAHANPAKAAGVYAAQNSLPTVTLDDLNGAKRVVIAGDPRKDARFDKMQYTQLFARQGSAMLWAVDGNRLLTATAPTEDAVTQVMQLVLAGGPVRESQANWVRRAVVRGIDRTIKAHQTPLLCGDIHMHTFYSDGNISPAGLMLEAMYSLQDFSVMTDHATNAGALRAKKLLADAGINYPLIIGEEVTTQYHSVVFPAEQTVYPDDLEPQELTAQVHAGGGFAQWNHPGFPAGWGEQYLANGMGDLGFDAWEHLPARYDAWLQAGVLPLITGSTDTHDGTFGEYPERTIVFTTKTTPEALVSALKQREAVAVLPQAGKLFYGQPMWERRALSSLADGGKLKEAKAQRIREMLRGARVADMLNASETSPVKPEQ